MRRVLAVVLVIVGFGGAVVSQGLSVALAASPSAALMEIDDTIQPSSARFLSRGIDTAVEEDAGFLVVVLDTPGGLLQSTRRMVEDILASPIPVVVYVSPPGARAASAGTFITAAAHVAAMAPGTNIGAASPVAAGGEDLPKTLESKATQDAAAFIRSIAEERGRNTNALEQTVLKATSFSAFEALDNNLIDLIAGDVDDLLAKLDGRPISLKEGTVVLQTKGIEIREIRQTPVERFLSFLADPNIAFLLLSLGSLGIFVELMSPGLFAPGIAGAISLALALVALGNLPVNWGGAGLVVLSMLLLFLEMQSPGIGVFGISGAVSFVLGAFLLFGGFSPPPIETPSFKVNVGLIVGVAVVMFGVLLFLVRDLASARRAGTAGPTTRPSLVGQPAVATTELVPGGTVHVAGEYWGAISDSGEAIAQGSILVVVSADGLVVRVSPRADEPGVWDSSRARSLLGQAGVAITDLAPRGTVHLAGEYWGAVTESGEVVPQGSQVQVVGIDDRVLRVLLVPDEETEEKASQVDSAS